MTCRKHVDHNPLGSGYTRSRCQELLLHFGREKHLSPGNQGTREIVERTLVFSFVCEEELFDRKEGEKKVLEEEKVSAIFQNSELLMWLEEGGNNKNKGSKSTLGSFNKA